MSDEGMNSLQDLLDQHDYELPQVGDIRVGTIVAITPQGVIVDLGLKRDGFAPVSDLQKLEPEERDALKVNEEVPIYVVNTEDPENLIVSIHLARLNQDWIEAEALMASGEMFEGEVIGYNKGGVIVPYGRIRGFVPISHLTEFTSGMGERRRQQRLARMRGETLGLKIIEVDRRRHRLVMSQRDAAKEWEEKKRGELMETLKEGDIRVGRVSGLRDFGAFVDLGGADGLVHISELSWHRIAHPREVVKVGDEIEVYVLGINQETQRISLSRKKLLENPWTTVSDRYSVNQLVEGRITRILDYGAFAEIEPGIEGLLHLSQLSRQPIEDPRSVVKEGEVHLLRVVSIDQKRQRIGLSLKAVTTNEQIEWMAEREIAESQRREEEAAAAAVVAAAHDKNGPASEPAVAEEMAGGAIEQAASEAAVESAAEIAEEMAVVEAVEEAVVEEVAASEAAAGETTAEEVAAEEAAAEEAVVEEMAANPQAEADTTGEVAETLAENLEETSG
jgi:small subunit ribosomal protein S1